jgi:hypothetical protein
MELSNNFITVDTVIDPITIDDFRILMDVRSITSASRPFGELRSVVIKLIKNKIYKNV